MYNKFKISRPRLQKIGKNLNLFLGSNSFFWIALAFFVVECTWVAVSFRFPMLFDERYHLGIIKLISIDNLPPVITKQPISADTFGNLAYSNASLYHYLMSFPYRILTHLTNSETVQVIILRILNILMVAYGLFIYAKLFDKIKIKKSIINLSILFFSLIPLVILVSPTISYDNMLFPLTALFLYYGILVAKDKKINAVNYMLFISFGLLAALVKFTFLPVLLSCGVFISIYEVRKHSTLITGRFLNSIRTIRVKKLVFLGLIIVGLVTLFVLRYGVSMIEYHTPIPSCDKVLSDERCESSYVYKMGKETVATRNIRTAVTPENYTYQWLNTITNQFVMTSNSTKTGAVEYGVSLPVISLLITTAVYVCIAYILLAWHGLNKKPMWYFLLATVLSVIVATYLFNIMTYYSAHEDLNVQTRYLLSIIPVFLVLSITSIDNVIKKRWIKLCGLIIVLILSTQGGGIIEHILSSNDGWFWDNSLIDSANDDARNILRPIVKETPIFK